MALNLEGKKQIVSEVTAVAEGALSAVIADYRGLTVAQMTELRVQARSLGVHVRVVRNTLLKRALKDTDFECLCGVLVGPVLLAFSLNDPGSAARVLRDFAKGHERLVVKVLAINQQLLEASDVDKVASLPTREEALTALCVVLNAPMVALVRTLNEVNGRLARTLAAVSTQQQSA